MQLCGQLWQYRTQWLNRAGDWDAPQWLAGMQAIDWPALSFPYQLLYWEWLGDYWRELDQPQSALQAYQQGLQPFIESPELAAAHPWAYLQLLRVNADYLSWQIPVPPQLYVITDLAEQHLCGFPELEPQRLHFLLAKMRALFLQQHWQAIIQRKETIILSHLERFQLETTSAGALVCLLLANTYLVLDNPSRVQYYMRRFQAASHLVEKPLRYTANILELISHWETNDVDLVEQRIRTMRRQLRQDQDAGFSPFYQLHLELITRLVRQPYERTRFASEVLLRIPDFQEDPIFPHYKFQNLERWVQAAAARRPLAEVIRSRPA